jgi:3-oxoadipate enol-lactonase
MPTAPINSISINYEIHGHQTGTWLVLINGLADDLQTWSANIPAFTAAGYRVLAYDNRGVGKTSRPPGPYTAALLAADLHALLFHLKIDQFHLLGVSMGGMIAQAYALAYPNGSPAAEGRQMLSLSLCCTYAQPSIFCERMFDLWAEMAQRMSVQDVMRDVTLWAFTVEFFRERTGELEAVEKAMRELDVPLEAYLAQLNVIREFDSRGELEGLVKGGKVLGGLDQGRVMVLAGEEDILIPVVLSRELCEAVVGSAWRTTRGGHGCLVRFPLVNCENRTNCDTDRVTVGVPGPIQPNGAGLSGHDHRELTKCERFPRYCTFPSSILHYANFSSRYQSLDRSQLALVRRLLANEVKESGMDVVSQVGGLQRTSLLLESQPGTLSGDGTAAVGDNCEQLFLGHVVLVVPKLVKVSHAVGQQSCEGAGESIALATSSLQATLAAADDGLFAV